MYFYSNRYLARLYLSESLLAMNKIELALHQLDTEIIKNENDLSFKMPITIIDKGNIKKSYDLINSFLLI